MDEKRARFEAQVLPHLDAAYRFARWLSHASGDAEDIVQEAFLRAFRGFDALRGSDAKAWLFTIVRNCHLTAIKQQQRRAHVPLPEDNDAHDGPMIDTTRTPEDASIQGDEKRLLGRLLASLPEEHRIVLMLREIEEMNYAQIAAAIDVPIGTVMSRLARSRAALKAKWLGETGGEPRAVR
jgi:RNA polymerase sigma-70 factor (ECF subfamily)